MITSGDIYGGSTTTTEAASGGNQTTSQVTPLSVVYWLGLVILLIILRLAYEFAS
jgi:hypothetical protein